MLKKQEKRIRRHKRVRAKIFGTSEIPRLSVFRSAKHISAQLIDDDAGKTLVSANDQEINKPKPRAKLKEGKDEKDEKDEKEIIRTGKVAIAYEVGMLIAEKAVEKKIKKVVFDRGNYQYHSRVKAVAEGAREKGLQF